MAAMSGCVMVWLPTIWPSLFHAADDLRIIFYIIAHYKKKPPAHLLL